MQWSAERFLWPFVAYPGRRRSTRRTLENCPRLRRHDGEFANDVCVGTLTLDVVFVKLSSVNRRNAARLDLCPQNWDRNGHFPRCCGTSPVPLPRFALE